MRYRFGVNYWPARSAMYMWQRFDLGEIREDMARIRALGLHLVRFFLRWDDFQPAPDTMDDAMLRRFDAVMQAIADAGLQAMPTLFCGHMSGVNWLPSWALDTSEPHGRFRTISGRNTMPYGIGDFYADEAMLRAQSLFAERVGERANGHAALYAWDLGNEFSNLREPRTPDDAARWSAMLTDVLVRASGGAVTGGTHGEDVERDRHLRPSSLAAPWGIATMHGYSVYSTFTNDRLDTSAVPFYARLMQAFSRKPLLFSEFGNPECPPGATHAGAFACLSEDEMATYGERVLRALHRIGTIGAMWWCWSDYADSLAALAPFDDAPHELRFGMLRADGRLKPVARMLARVAAESWQVLPTAAPIVDEDVFYASLPQGLHALYHRYRR